jgi:hypothetical protein
MRCVDDAIRSAADHNHTTRHEQVASGEVSGGAIEGQGGTTRMHTRSHAMSRHVQSIRRPLMQTTDAARRRSVTRVVVIASLTVMRVCVVSCPYLTWTCRCGWVRVWRRPRWRRLDLCRIDSIRFSCDESPRLDDRISRGSTTAKERPTREPTQAGRGDQPSGDEDGPAQYVRRPNVCRNAMRCTHPRESESSVRWLLAPCHPHEESLCAAG